MGLWDNSMGRSKYKNLSLMTQHPHKNLGTAAHASNSWSEGTDRWIHEFSMVIQSRKTWWASSSVSDLVSRQRGGEQHRKTPNIMFWTLHVELQVPTPTKKEISLET